MRESRTRTGIASFVFAILLLIFNWPVMSIPAPGKLLSWLFGAWLAAIALLGLAAASAARAERRLACPPPDLGMENGGDPLGIATPPLDDRPGCGDV